ncbi:hypothetical protein A2U01_0101725, partial [Trifolium medium]|nr:hypothetical protein [Trifolium medium]
MVQRGVLSLRATVHGFCSLFGRVSFLSPFWFSPLSPAQ